MNKIELETWVLTDDGKEWLDEKKSGLLSKNTELLKEISDSNAKLKSLTDESNALTGKNKSYENYIKGKLINSTFTKDTSIQLIAGTNNVVTSILNEQAKANGGFSLLINDKNEIKLTDGKGKDFQQYFDEFAKTDTGKSYIKNPSSGGGARGGFNDGCMTRSALESMTPEMVARNLDKPDFQNSLKSILTQE